jgi:Domain of unknown function (DUF4157)
MLRKTVSRTNNAEKTSTRLPAAGTAIPEVERTYFENRLGSNFANVRVHTDPSAAAQAEVLGAKAFTVGKDIFFGAGRYQPGMTAGKQLLAHELTHVVQQSQPLPASSDAEPRARTAAAQVTEGHDVSSGAIGAAEQSVQCDDDEEKKKSETNDLSRFIPQLTPQLKLDPSLIPPDTWLNLQTNFQAHGRSLTDRDASSIESEWARSSKLLDTLGVSDSFKLWFITKKFILQKGIESQVEDLNARENPNSQDIFKQQQKIAYPNAWQTPIFTLFEKKF